MVGGMGRKQILSKHHAGNDNDGILGGIGMGQNMSEPNMINLREVKI